MATNSLVRPLGITAAILGITQGVAWAILGFLTILIRFEAWTPQPGIKTYGQKLNTVILKNYMNVENAFGGNFNEELFIRRGEFYIWAIIYLITSLLWVGVSCFLIFVLIKKKHNLLRKALLGWALWTTSISFCDLLLTCLLASDYHTLTTAYNSAEEKNEQENLLGRAFTVLACGVMMTLAAKGFVLWIVNVAFDCIIIKFFVDMSKGTKDPNDSTSNIIPGFEGAHFADDDTPSRPKLGRSNSFTASSFGTFTGLPRLPPIQSTNERLANLGRQSARSRTTSVKTNDYTNYAGSHRTDSNYYPGNTSPDRPQKPALRRY